MKDHPAVLQAKKADAIWGMVSETHYQKHWEHFAETGTLNLSNTMDHPRTIADHEIYIIYRLK